MISVNTALIIFEAATTALTAVLVIAAFKTHFLTELWATITGRPLLIIEYKNRRVYVLGRRSPHMPQIISAGRLGQYMTSDGSLKYDDKGHLIGVALPDAAAIISPHASAALSKMAGNAKFRFAKLNVLLKEHKAITPNGQEAVIPTERIIAEGAGEKDGKFEYHGVTVDFSEVSRYFSGLDATNIDTLEKRAELKARLDMMRPFDPKVLLYVGIAVIGIVVAYLLIKKFGGQASVSPAVNMIKTAVNQTQTGVSV